MAMEIAKTETEFTFPFEQEIAKSDISFICEVKRASPSKGLIAKEFPYLEIATEYEKASADCISVLTEPEYFKGNDCYLKEISQRIRVPIIRKDFVIDEYMIYEAKVLGASCVLLIVAFVISSSQQPAAKSSLIFALTSSLTVYLPQSLRAPNHSLIVSEFLPQRM